MTQTLARAATLAACACLLLAGKPCHAEEPAFKLAIIDPEDSPGTALLAAELSRRVQISLVERQELERIVDEKKLQTMTSAREFGALGALLSADGLLVVEKIPLPDGGEKPTARLISVKNGACLLFAGGEDSPSDEWAAGFSELLVRALPMAKISRGDALPLCVVGVRASVFTPEAAVREAAVARLLEMNLAAGPGVILLDRRRLGDIAFERSLEAADLPSLWESAALIDGIIEEGGDNQPVRLKLRISRRDGSESGSVSAEGKPGEPAALAKALAEEVLKSLRRKPPEETASVEPREFLREAAWAWRSGLYERAEEALATATTLGERSADATALGAWLLAERAWPEGYFFQGKTLKREAPTPERQGLLLEEALALLEKYEAEGGRVDVVRSSKHDLDLAALREEIVERASKFLHASDAGKAPGDFSALRRKVRAVSSIDGPRAKVRGALIARHVRDWAEDGAALVRHYEKLLFERGGDKGFLQYFPRSREEALGPRFQDEGTKKGWDAMIAQTEMDSDLRALAYLVQAGRGKTPAEEEALRKFLGELAEKGYLLYNRGYLTGLLWGYLCRGEAREKFPEERAMAFIGLSQKLPGYVHGVAYLTSEWKLPDELAREVGAAVEAYRRRCLEAAPDPANRAGVEKTFAEISANLLKANPQLRTEGAPGSLTVSRFWHPYDFLPERQGNFSVSGMVADGDAVWFAGHDKETRVFEVNPQEGTTRSHEIPGISYGGMLAVTPNTVWMMNGKYPGGDRPMQMSLSRLDRKTGKSVVHPLPQGEMLQVAGERVFVSNGHPHGGFGDEATLLEVDPETGGVEVMVSSRRRPPQSPVDDAENLGVTGVAIGPGGGLHVIISGKAEGIYDVSKNWSRTGSVMWADVLRFGELTLLAGAKGEAILLDPREEKPIRWLASPDSRAEDREEALWLAPRIRMDMRWGAASFRRKELFMVERNDRGEQGLRWWHEGGQREGLAIPLRFAMPEETLGKLKGAVAEKDLEALRSPHTESHALEILALESGLIVQSRGPGFWFIPNAELEAWRDRETSPAGKTR